MQLLFYLPLGQLNSEKWTFGEVLKFEYHAILDKVGSRPQKWNSCVYRRRNAANCNFVNTNFMKRIWSSRSYHGGHLFDVVFQ